MKELTRNRIKFSFYTLIGIMGFFLLVIDTTPGHDIWGHLEFYRNNVDAVEGIIFIFFSGFEIGRMLNRGEKL